MATHTISIPGWHPVLQNKWDGRHWSVRAKLKKYDAEVIAVYAAKQGIPKAKGKRRVTLTVVLGKRQRGGDPDAYNKSLNDALKLAGLVIDDRKEWIELMPVQYERGAQRAARIVLEDL